jgi:hypothetical protein
MWNRRKALLSLSALLFTLTACLHRPALAPDAEEVRVSSQEPGPNCVADGQLVGYADVALGEAPASEATIESAMNDVRNEAVVRSATFVQTDPPQVEGGRVIVTGTAHCMATSSR